MFEQPTACKLIRVLPLVRSQGRALEHWIIMSAMWCSSFNGARSTSVYWRELSQGACGIEALYLILINELTPGPRGDLKLAV